MALLCALILVLGAAPSLGQPAQETAKDIYARKPDKGTRDDLLRARRVTLSFKKAIVTDDDTRETTITVKDACDRVLSNKVTESKNTTGNEEFVGKAWVKLDRLDKKPKGLYYVRAKYWLESEEEEISPTPGVDDAANPEARIYTYKFRVSGGPNCDGSGGGGNNPPGHDPGGNNDKKRVWSSTSGSSHDDDGGHVGHENLRSPTSASSTGSTYSSSTNTSDFNPYTSYTSPTIPSSDGGQTNYNSNSTTPFGEDDFGDPFGESTGNSPLSDPTDPSLYESEAGQIPEEAEDQQTLSATPDEELGPESGTLVVALATALLLGVGGGLFLRRTDPAPIRSQS